VSNLYLIRHAQASFGAADYDVLSELGVRQSELLGKWFATTRTRLDAVYSGPRKRQQDTARHLVDSARDAGAATPPELSIVDELDEFPFDAVLQQDGLEDARGFAEAMGRWARGEVETLGSASFRAFAARVKAGLDRIVATEGRGRSVAVVTSAGPISLSLQVALELRDTVALKLGWNIANSSLTSFKYRDGEMTLASYNSTPHLPWPEMITYR
jgi:broad specificity phosphatase PhoE